MYNTLIQFLIQCFFIGSEFSWNFVTTKFNSCEIYGNQDKIVLSCTWKSDEENYSQQIIKP